MNRFDGKTILVTGAASGIGAACARRLYAEGASVVAVDLRQEDLDKLVSDFPDADRILGIATDVADRDEVAAFLRAAIDRFGIPDGLVNCAGIRCVGTVLDVDPEDWQRVIAVNLDGTFHTCRAFAGAVTEAGAKAAIVNLTSAAGVRGNPNRVGYAASKFGVTGITYTMALELAPMGIRVNAVAPGMIRTPMTVWGARSLHAL